MLLHSLIFSIIRLTFSCKRTQSDSRNCFSLVSFVLFQWLRNVFLTLSVLQNFVRTNLVCPNRIYHPPLHFYYDFPKTLSGLVRTSVYVPPPLIIVNSDEWTLKLNIKIWIGTWNCSMKSNFWKKKIWRFELFVVLKFLKVSISSY